MIPGDVPAWVADYIGIPYAEGKSGMDGADCWGLLMLAYNRHSGRVLPPYEGARWQNWKAGPDAVSAGASGYSEKFTPVEPGQERLFDGILFRLRGQPIHVGLVVSRGWMLHVQEGADAVVEQYAGTTVWGRRLAGIFRHD